MRAGQLNKKVTVQSYTSAANSFGEMIETWSTYATRNASVEPLQGREFWAAQQLNSEVTSKIRLRYDSITGAITPKMRVQWDSRTFKIHSVINVNQRNREVQLMCSELN